MCSTNARRILRTKDSISFVRFNGSIDTCKVSSFNWIGVQSKIDQVSSVSDDDPKQNEYSWSGLSRSSCVNVNLYQRREKRIRSWWVLTREKLHRPTNLMERMTIKPTLRDHVRLFEIQFRDIYNSKSLALNHSRSCLLRRSPLRLVAVPWSHEFYNCPPRFVNLLGAVCFTKHGQNSEKGNTRHWVILHFIEPWMVR